MLFKILRLRSMAKEGLEDPKKFAQNQANDIFIGALIGPVVMLLAFLAFLCILSYTHLLGGPYGIARFFFWFLIIAYGIIGYVMYKVYFAFQGFFSRVARSTRSATSTAQETSVKGNIRDAEVVGED